MRVDKDEDGTRQEPRLSAYYYSRDIMRRDLIAALRSAGVLNLQEFPAVITEAGRDTSIEDYAVVNVVGLVSCAAMDASDGIPFAGKTFFTELVIDPTKARDLLMFRLAESHMDILVHERVARELQPRAFPFLVLTPVKEAR